MQHGEQREELQVCTQLQHRCSGISHTTGVQWVMGTSLIRRTCWERKGEFPFVWQRNGNEKKVYLGTGKEITPVLFSSAGTCKFFVQLKYFLLQNWLESDGEISCRPQSCLYSHVILLAECEMWVGQDKDREITQ